MYVLSPQHPHPFPYLHMPLVYYYKMFAFNRLESSTQRRFDFRSGKSGRKRMIWRAKNVRAKEMVVVAKSDRPPREVKKKFILPQFRCGNFIWSYCCCCYNIRLCSHHRFAKERQETKWRLGTGQSVSWTEQLRMNQAGALVNCVYVCVCV